MKKIVIPENIFFTLKLFLQKYIFQILMMMIKRFLSIKIAVWLAVLFVFCTPAIAQTSTLIPLPHQILRSEGSFQMNEFVPVFLNKNASIEEQRSIWMLCDEFESMFGKSLKTTDKIKGNIIVLRNLSIEKTTKNQKKTILPVGEEGYQINISPQKVEILANSDAGLFYGSQTFLQLIRTTSLSGTLDCMTINDIPSSQQRYIRYDWNAERIPSFNYVKSLIRFVSQYKFNGIVFFNDSLASPFAEMELFYLRQFAAPYHVDIITDKGAVSHVQPLNIDLKQKVYPEFYQPSKALFHAIAAEENPDKMIVFSNDASTLFIDKWYHLLWASELLWQQPRDNDKETFEKYHAPYDHSLDVQFFGIDFLLAEQLTSFDSLQIISLTEKDFWASVKQSAAIQNHHPAKSKFALEKALKLEETWQFFAENVPMAYDEVVYSMIFSVQRAEFIALKNLLQESLTKKDQNHDDEAIEEAATILIKNIRHLKQAHEALWTAEYSTAFPKDLSEKYDRMLSELESIGF